MPSIPFVKAHGAGNDFLVVERGDVIATGVRDIARLAVRMCDRQRGVGADGLEVVGSSRHEDALASAHLWNSDGSKAEISGNGTRCVAAYLAWIARAPATAVIETGAGPREVELVRARHPEYEFRMASDASACRVVEGSLVLRDLPRQFSMTVVDVGNPQCVCPVDSFDFDWQGLGALVERHDDFPRGTNVSFVIVRSPGTAQSALDVRFWERGAGHTLSSGTGALGAAIAARHHGWAGDPVAMRTEGGSLTVDWSDGIGLTGPARIVARGEFEL